jgi:chemosensory pili system protein ChpA (sensor histidine kinase/response regulator)
MSDDATAEYNALDWVKSELDSVLVQARQSLEQYLESENSDTEALQAFRDLLKQVQGTLQMVELHGAVMLADEMLAVVERVQGGDIKDASSALEVLMRAVIQLPGYIEYVQTGHKDTAVVLLPLLNDLRTSREANLLTENVFFVPDHAAADEALPQDRTDEDLQKLAAKLRHSFQLGLLGWFRNKDVAGSLGRLHEVLTRLRRASDSNETQRFWWVAGALAQALQQEGLESGVTVKMLMGRVDRQIKSVIDHGESETTAALPADLVNNLLYYVAQATVREGDVGAVKKAFRLDRLVASDTEIEAARESLGGPNLALMNTVTQVVKDDLAEVKDQFELFINADEKDVSMLEPLVEKLHRIADTLGMLGLGQPRKLMQREAEVVQELLSNQGGDLDTVLQEAAEVLLQVETAIDDFLLGRESGEDDEGKGAGPFPAAELKRVQGAVIREVLVDINRCKDAVLEFISTPSDQTPIHKVPELIERIKGAISMLPMEGVTSLLDALQQFIKQKILAEGVVPAGAQLEALADAITSVEFYLEAIDANRGEHRAILDVGKASVAKLESAASESETALIEEIELDNALPEQEASEALEVLNPDEMQTQVLDTPLTIDEAQTEELEIPFSVEDLQTEEVEKPLMLDEAQTQELKRPLIDEDLEIEDLEAAGSFEPPPEAVEPVQVAAEEKPVEWPEALVGEPDPEILDIFLEEAEEEIERIREYLPRWEQNTGDEEALTTVRRSFHTLKGSGRLVGAMLIGEFAWRFESLLNRVIDKTIEPADYIFETLHKAVAALPQLVTQLRGEGDAGAEVYALMEEAEAMCSPDYTKKNFPGSEVAESEADLNAFVEENAELEAPAAEPAAEDQSESPTSVMEVPAAEAGESEWFTADEAVEPDASLEAAAIETPEQEAETVFDLETLAEEEAAELEDYQVSEEAGEEPRIDPVLFDIFKQESEQHLATLEEILSAAGTGDIEPSPDMLRALHTLNGSARTADVPEMSDIFAALERYAKGRQELDLPYPGAALPLLGEAITHARRVLEALAENTSVPTGDSLREQIEDLRVDMPSSTASAEAEAAAPVSESRPEPARPAAPATGMPPPDMPADLDGELVDIFLEEATEIMDACDNTLQAWEDNPGQNEPITELQRHLHTLKGGARMAGFKNIGDLSHAVESLIIPIAEGQRESGPQIFSGLHRALDRLSAMLDRARGSEPVPAEPQLIVELDSLRAGKPVETASAPAEESASPAAEVVPEAGETSEAAPAEVTGLPHEETPAVAGEEAAPSGEAAEHESNVVELARSRPEARPTPAARPTQSQELVRVRSDLLDTLVNNAGEVNIFHSRLEQQVTNFSFNLNELDQTVRRLREQLRRLELETEAQIRFSYEQEHEGEEEMQEDFDPLEMDRYSTLQQLSRALAESVNDLVSIQDLLREQVRDAETLMLQQSRVSTDLQDGLMRTRMVQFTGMVPRLRRVVRQTADELGKKVEFLINGESSELDRSLLERMVAPLEHMLRNAIYHGIEAPAERVKAGKPETGTVSISIGREGSDVVLRVTDDGGGINLDAVREKALKQGLMGPADKLGDNDILQFILESGFSTAKEISQISGRGVGMDVVNNEIKQLGGVLRIDSKQGQGTTFTVSLPFTLAINQALLVQAGEDLFAVPLTSVEGIVRVGGAELAKKFKEDDPVLEYAANEYHVKHLGALLGVADPVVENEALLYPVLLIRSGDQRMALYVDALLGSREIVVKSVGPQISKAKGISGATILGDGRVVLILDMSALVRLGAGRHFTYVVAERIEEQPAKLKTVMVVDDSITIRKVTARMLERNDYAVITAKDGVDAVAQLHEQVPDLMLLDIEMPRMDGFELATHMRNDERLKNVPIIMITSRTGEKHRERAMSIGVNRYLGKPYQEAELLENIQDMLTSSGDA